MEKYDRYQQDFLWFSYFGIPFERSSEDLSAYRLKALNACISRAYRDVCRKLSFSKPIKGETLRNALLKEKKKRFSPADGNDDAKTVSLIRSHIDVLLKDIFSDQDSFDSWHKCACECLKSLANELNEEKGKEKGNTVKLFEEDSREPIRFTIGHAQKWINMTLKYMLIMGLWDNELCGKIKFFHIPIDGYIMDAAAVNEGELINLDVNNTCGLGLKKPDKYWYKMDEYTDYLDYQKKVREKCVPDYPVWWESKAWIAQAMSKNNGAKKASND